MSRATIVTAIGIFVALGAAGGGLAYTKSRALAAQKGQGGYEPSENVRTAIAREVEWRPTADLVGTVVSLRSVRVSNERAGLVKDVRFTSGQLIEAGQVLLTLDDAVDQADLATALANVRVAEANLGVGAARLGLAETELRRMEGALAARGVSDSEIDRARSELAKARADQDRAQAEIDAAKARVTQVRVRLEKTVVKAPFRGRAGMLSVHEGQYLAEGTTIVGLEEASDRIYIDFAIPQDYMARVRTGTAVMASSDVLGADPVRIEVAAIDALVDYGTRNVRVRGIVEDRAGTLRPGMFIRIRVPVEEPRTYVVVPNSAVRRASYAEQVFVIGPGESPDKTRAKSRYVKLGPAVGDDVIVLEGLTAGEEVASTGAFKLRDGALVTRAPAEAPAAATATEKKP